MNDPKETPKAAAKLQERTPTLEKVDKQRKLVTGWHFLRTDSSLSPIDRAFAESNYRAELAKSFHLVSLYNQEARTDDAPTLELQEAHRFGEAFWERMERLKAARESGVEAEVNTEQAALEILTGMLMPDDGKIPDDTITRMGSCPRCLCVRPLMTFEVTQPQKLSKGVARACGQDAKPYIVINSVDHPEAVAEFRRVWKGQTDAGLTVVPEEENKPKAAGWARIALLDAEQCPTCRGHYRDRRCFGPGQPQGYCINQWHDEDDGDGR